MDSLNKLIKVTKELNLIESSDDIDFLFLGFEFNKDEPLDNIIDKALEWGYVNDELEDFFQEHWDVLVDTEIITHLIECNITDSHMYGTDITLTKFSSQNKYYYKIDASGINEDMFETNSFYSTEENEDDEKQISRFKVDCLIAYTCDGEFTKEECIKNGSTIDFSY